MGELRGTTLIITGAGGGIGSALAVELAGEGVNLVLNGRNQEKIENVAAQCRESAVEVNFLSGSAASRQIADDLVGMAMRMDNFYGFIQVAGVLNPGPFIWELNDSQFNEIFEANVGASYQIARAAFPCLVEKGDGIAVFFGSGAAELTLPGIGAYCAAKAAEEHLARQLAAEAPSVTTLIFRPGVVDTPMVASAITAHGSAAGRLRRDVSGYRGRGELLLPEVPARALVSILKNDPRRFHGRVASWRDSQKR
jgi:NAD(P)-dependent dehydrogenase (short-subunit alcohol dehydrogenase family)